MGKYNKLIYSLLVIWGACGMSQHLMAQKNTKKIAKIPVIEIKGTITDELGNPIEGVTLLSGEGSVQHYTDENGNFSLYAKANETLLLEAVGYKDEIINISSSLPQVITMKSEKIFTSEKDKHERPDGSYTYQRNIVGAVAKVSIDNILRYPDLQLSNALQGQASGLIAIAEDGGLGYNKSSLYVRGQHNNGINSALVIVDGIERPIDDILPEEIESIEVLKDATAKILYGSAATNGVIVVRTKRGEAHKRIVRTGVEFGVQPSLRMPKFLDSYDYTTLFNEARMNDGMSPFYSEEQINGYKNSSGVNDVLYPNVNYYDYFLLSQNLYRKGTVEFNGGNDGVKYALIGGYTGGAGLEAVGQRSQLHRANARGNLDIKITDYLTVTADVAARIELKKWGVRDGGEIFSQLSTNRPNEYPFIIPNDLMEGQFTVNEDGTPFFGASTRVTDNLYGDLVYGGNSSERYVNSQTNLGAQFDFNEYVKGLTFNAYITFDNYSYLNQKLTNTYPTYAIDTYTGTDGETITRYTQMKKLDLPKNQVIQSNETYRNFGLRANIGYERTVGAHDFSTIAAVRYAKNEKKGMVQDFKDLNMTLRMNYGFDNCYLFELTLAGMGSNKFADTERFFFSPAIGAGWIISNESFFNGLESIDFLKLKGSFGILGYTGNNDYLLYQTGWQSNGNYNFYQDQTDRKVGLVRWGNTDLKWERSQETNIGIEGLFFNKRLMAEVNYFHENRKNIIGINTAKYAATAGNYTMYENIGQVVNKGFDFSVEWNEKVGNDLQYTAGLNMTYTKNRLVKWNELDGVEDYRKSVGRPTSTIFGLDAIGLFGRDVTLDGHPLQTYGIYKNGDIAYSDLNNDNVVDDNDQKALGQTFPITTLGVNIDIKYKGWGMFLLGTMNAGVTKLCTNSYYWNNGLNGYSKLALERYHEVNNPNGTMPRLTTTTDGNNFQNSSFWTENASFFRLKNVELSYTFENKMAKSVIKKCKIFARGTNLLTFSKIKELDPERLNAGLANYPVYMTITGGCSITF